MPAITFKPLGAVKVFFPPGRKVQTTIVDSVDALAAESQRLTRLYWQKQAALAALKSSLLHQAFSGVISTMSVNLNPEKALIFRIVHADNVPWILDHDGLHC